MLYTLPILALAATATASVLGPILGGSATVTTAAPASTTTAAGPNPSEVYINSIAYGGTGCPQGSVGSFISTDRTTSELPFLYTRISILLIKSRSPGSLSFLTHLLHQLGPESLLLTIG